MPTGESSGDISGRVRARPAASAKQSRGVSALLLAVEQMHRCTGGRSAFAPSGTLPTVTLSTFDLAAA
jgi:hypothetical protein